MPALFVILVVACDRLGSNDVRRDEAGGEIDRSWAPESVETVKGVPASAIADAIRKRLGAKRPPPLSAEQWRHVHRLYGPYAGTPLWLDHDGLRERRTKALMSALLNADQDALPLDGYPLAELHRVLSALLDARRPSPELLADADVVITAAYVALGEDLLTGAIDPRTVSQAWNINPREEQVDSALARTLRDQPLDQALARMRPLDEDYRALQREIGHYRQLVARGGWTEVPAGKALKPGDSIAPERLTALRERLRIEGFLPGDTSARASASRTSRGPGRDDSASRSASTSDSTLVVYDAVTAGAVAEFQRRHGIVVDSVLGKETAVSLNVPATYRLGQIAANLERFRWLPRTLGTKYVLVNVPAFQLEAYDDGRRALTMKVVVGADYEDRATPVFSDSMQNVVFRPYWNAPDSIAAKELWPKEQASPGYFARNDYEVYEEGGKTRVRQRPGDKNALGLVKFLFPNDFSIYLHDTPEHELFKKDVRAFSHGCIRLERPAEMAQWVLGWPADSVQRAMEQGRDDKWVKLSEKIPVYIAYFTTFTRDGKLYFANDLYRRDDALIRAIGSGAIPSVDATKAVRALRVLAED